MVHHSSFRRLIYKGLRISIEKKPFSCENSQNMLDYSAQRRILDLRPIFSILLTSPSCIRPLSPPCTRVFLPWHSSPICACPSPAAQVWMFPSCQLGRLILLRFLRNWYFMQGWLLPGKMDFTLPIDCIALNSSRNIAQAFMPIAYIRGMPNWAFFSVPCKNL